MLGFRAVLAGTALGALVAFSGLRPGAAQAAQRDPLPSPGAAAVVAVPRFGPVGPGQEAGGVVGASLEDSDTAPTQANRVTAAQWAQYKARAPAPQRNAPASICNAARLSQLLGAPPPSR